MSSTCPICHNPCLPHTDNQCYPFCSERCQLIDLGRWLNEDYRIPGEATGEDDGQGEQLSPDKIH